MVRWSCHSPASVTLELFGRSSGPTCGFPQFTGRRFGCEPGARLSVRRSGLAVVQQGEVTMRTFLGRLISPALSIGCLVLFTTDCANRGMVAPDHTTVVQCSITRQECIAESLGPIGAQCDTFQPTTPSPLLATVCAASADQTVMDNACAV